MTRYFALFVALLANIYCIAQQTDSINTTSAKPTLILANDLQKNYFGQSKVILERDPLIDSLFVLDKEVNLQQGTKGYRVQLYNSNSLGSQARKEAYEISTRYHAKFPDGDECYTYFNRPFWTVRIGNYRQFHEALKAKKKLEKAFPDIKDNISVIPNTVIKTD